MELTLLRHGRSRADDERVHEGSYDSPLTDEGRSQVRALADYWAGRGVTYDRVHCSTLCRASETAAIVADALGLTAEPSDLLREFDNGPVAGLPYAEAQERYPSSTFRHRLDPFTAEGGESRAAFEARALRALEMIWAGRGERVLVVSHGGMLNAILSALTGARGTAFTFGDTAFATLRVSTTDDTVRLLGVNQTPHLDR